MYCIRKQLILWTFSFSFIPHFRFYFVVSEDFLFNFFFLSFNLLVFIYSHTRCLIFDVCVLFGGLYFVYTFYQISWWMTDKKKFIKWRTKFENFLLWKARKSIRENQQREGSIYESLIVHAFNPYFTWEVFFLFIHFTNKRASIAKNGERKAMPLRMESSC